jgi:dolichol kinase
MKTQNQKPKESPQLNDFKFHNILVNYTDAVIRGLIAFFVVGILSWIIFVGYFHIPIVFMLVIAFISSILISPFLNKIKLGFIVVNKYENWLQKTFARAE